MKLINSKVEILEQSNGLGGVYKQIELAGRTCYKSEDKITADSAKGFVDRMIKSGHGAMLEAGTVYLAIENFEDIQEEKYKLNSYSKAVAVFPNMLYVTTNLRVLVENNWMDDLQYICEPTEHHEKRITVKFTCDRGVSHEFVRHRVFSFAQESTRYCNYGKDKFGNELTFIKPSWWTSEDDKVSTLYLQPWKEAEHCYLTLIENGVQPQQARQILPNALKTELVMTGTIDQWKGFFKLRSPKYGATGVHPDAAKLADELYEQIKDKL